jgi:hypothetical protein
MEDLESRIKEIIGKYNGENLDNEFLNNIDIGSQDVGNFIQALTKLVESEKEKVVEDLFHKFNMGVLELKPVTHDMSIQTVVAHFRVKLFGTFQDTLAKLTDSKVGGEK